jgi:hypothetical protein
MGVSCGTLEGYLGKVKAVTFSQAADCSRQPRTTKDGQALGGAERIIYWPPPTST